MFVNQQTIVINTVENMIESGLYESIPKVLNIVAVKIKTIR